MNIYADPDARKFDSMFLFEKRNVWCGSPRLLAEMVIGRNPLMDYPRPLNSARCEALFQKQFPGVKKSTRVGHGKFFWVNRKVFKKWVRQNAQRFMTTAREQERFERDIQKANEVYREELDRDMREEISLTEETMLFAVGDKVVFREPSAYGQGPFEVANVVEVPPGVRNVGHPQWVDIGKRQRDGTLKGWDEKKKMWCNPIVFMAEKRGAFSGKWFRKILPRKKA